MNNNNIEQLKNKKRNLEEQKKQVERKETEKRREVIELNSQINILEISMNNLMTQISQAEQVLRAARLSLRNYMFQLETLYHKAYDTGILNKSADEQEPHKREYEAKQRQCENAKQDEKNAVQNCQKLNTKANEEQQKLQRLQTKRNTTQNKAESASREVVRIIQDINKTQQELDYISVVNNFDPNRPSSSGSSRSSANDSPNTFLSKRSGFSN